MVLRGDAGQQLHRIPDRLPVEDQGGAGDGNADESEERHGGEQARRLPEHLVSLAVGVAGEVRNVEREGSPKSHHRGQPGDEQGEHKIPERALLGLRLDQGIRLRQDGADAPHLPGCPEEQRQAHDDQERRSGGLHPLDAVGAGPDEIHVDDPEKQEAEILRHSVAHKAPIAAKTCPALPENGKNGVDGHTPDPGLDAEPAAGHQRTQQGGNMCSHRAEGGPGVDRKRDPVLRAGMGVNHQRHQHDGIAEQDRQEALPPVHARTDHAGGEHVSGNAHAHPHPQGGDMPAVPGALPDFGGSKIFVAERADRKIGAEFDQTPAFIYGRGIGVHGRS